jgi:hypothetical protein
VRRLILFVAFFSLIALSCKQDNTDYKKSMAQPSWLHDVMGTYTNILVHDIFSPPVASRNYAYTSIAAYEAARHLNPDYVSLGGQLNGFERSARA